MTFTPSILTADVPECKTNNVSFMKHEPLLSDVRGIVAMSSEYLCYSVTQKRNPLRVIDAHSGEKALLRGHNGAVLDMCFSPLDPALLCTVQGCSANSAAAEEERVFVWQRLAEEADWKAVKQLTVPAKLVRAHPSQPHLWAIADDCHAALFSSAQEGQGGQGGQEGRGGLYENIPMHVTLEASNVITGARSSEIGDLASFTHRPLDGAS